jgi:hypothetical protein
MTLTIRQDRPIREKPATRVHPPVAGLILPQGLGLNGSGNGRVVLPQTLHADRA